jgi:GT2 family glycosyltransferase
MDLSVIVVYYRSPGALRDCLASLPAALSGLRSEVIVVDNASGDGMAEELERTHPEVRVFVNDENLGFARGVNRGLAEARGRCLALLNPDTQVAPGAFAALVAHLDHHAGTGAVGPKIVDPDGTLQLSCRRFPTHWTGFFNRYSLLTRLFPRNPWSRAYLMLDFDHASTRAVDWISGACLVTRREVVERVGPMDEAFFLFNEDVDWCRRMHAAGYEVVYLPAATCMHAIGASKGAIPAWLIWRRHQGMRHYFHKHHPGPWPWMALTDLGIVLRAALQIAIQPLRAFGAAGRGVRP